MYATHSRTDWSSATICWNHCTLPTKVLGRLSYLLYILGGVVWLLGRKVEFNRYTPQEKYCRSRVFDERLVRGNSRSQYIRLPSNLEATDISFQI